MSHAVSQFLVSAFLYLALTRDFLKEKRTSMAMGFILGLATLVRPQDALFIVVPLWLMLLQWKNAGKVILEDLPALCWMTCTMIFIATLQLLVYKVEYGDLTRVPYLIEGATEQRPSSFNWTNPQVVSVLFSGFHGLFAWHPITLVAVIGIFVSIRKQPEHIPLLLAFFLQVYLISSWYNWWQGASFGGRMFSSCSYIFVVGLASLWNFTKTPLTQRIVVLLITGVIIWNMLLAMQYTSQMIPGEDALTMKQIAANQLRVLPFFINKFINR